MNEHYDNINDCVLSGVSSIALASDIWSSNAKEDYISVVAHFIVAG